MTTKSEDIADILKEATEEDSGLHAADLSETEHTKLHKSVYLDDDDTEEPLASSIIISEGDEMLRELRDAGIDPAKKLNSIISNCKYITQISCLKKEYNWIESIERSLIEVTSRKKQVNYQYNIETLEPGFTFISDRALKVLNDAKNLGKFSFHALKEKKDRYIIELHGALDEDLPDVDNKISLIEQIKILQSKKFEELTLYRRVLYLSELSNEYEENHLMIKFKNLVLGSIARYREYWANQERQLKESESILSFLFSPLAEQPKERELLTILESLVGECDRVNEIFHVLGFFYNQILPKDTHYSTAQPYSLVSFIIESFGTMRRGFWQKIVSLKEAEDAKQGVNIRFFSPFCIDSADTAHTLFRYAVRQRENLVDAFRSCKVNVRPVVKYQEDRIKESESEFVFVSWRK